MGTVGLFEQQYAILPEDKVDVWYFLRQIGFRDENQGAKVTVFSILQNTGARTRVAGQDTNEVFKRITTAHRHQVVHG